jgi:drug/metabolite transporter superfamily protein YnfA
LARTFHEVADDEEVMAYDAHGGIFVAWAMIKKEFQNGVVRHLNDALGPKIKNKAGALKKAKPVPVQPPRPKSASE